MKANGPAILSGSVRLCRAMVRNLRGFAAMVVCAAAFAGSLHADIVTLTDGRTWEGKIVSETKTAVTIRTVGGNVSVPRDTIRSIEHKMTQRELYEKKLSALDKTSANQHYLLGLWCQKHRLPKEADYHLEYAVALDEDHAGARQALGQVKYRGKWMPEAEAKEAQGLRFYDGRWMTKEAADEAEAADLQRRLQREVARQVRAAAEDVVNPVNDEQRQRAIHRLLNWRDPLAYDAIVGLLRHPEPAVREVALRAIERLEIRVAQREVLLHALYDSDQTVRERARRLLARGWHVEMLTETLKALANMDEPQVRVAAAKLLGEVKELRAVDALIDNLYHTYRVKRVGAEAPPTLGLTRRRDVARDVQYDPVAAQVEGVEGIGSTWRPLDAPDDPSLVYIVNYAALDALRAITGKDFGVDRTAWRNWWDDNRDTFKRP